MDVCIDKSWLGSFPSGKINKLREINLQLIKSKAPKESSNQKAEARQSVMAVAAVNEVNQTRLQQLIQRASQKYTDRNHKDTIQHHGDISTATTTIIDPVTQTVKFRPVSFVVHNMMKPSEPLRMIDDYDNEYKPS